MMNDFDFVAAEVAATSSAREIGAAYAATLRRFVRAGLSLTDLVVWETLFGVTTFKHGFALIAEVGIARYTDIDVDAVCSAVDRLIAAGLLMRRGEHTWTFPTLMRQPICCSDVHRSLH